ncbi:uncharacterized protein LOC143886841 isoform X2 [Tasmannia lanceolata]|uniref:uncharacterized protein LOC143886841 isoform X2 n=1 Tax=Tasmannia lanceolata TaxID=3420 RepID=UPI004064A4E4
MPRAICQEAQQKMQCALKRTSSNIEKVVDGGGCNLSKKSLEGNNCKFYSKEPEVSALILRNSDQRCFVFTLVAIDERWKFLAPFVLPLQQTDQANRLGSSPHIKMDGLEPASLSPVISFPVDLQVGQRGRLSPGYTCSAKSFTGTSSSGDNVSWQSRNRGLLNKRTKASKVSTNSSQQNYNTSNDLSVSAYGGSKTTGSTEVVVKDIPKTGKSAKKNSRKKAKKKGKRHKKPSSSGDCHISENKLSGNTTSGVPLPEAFVEKADNKDNGNDIMNLSPTPTTPTPYSAEADELETTTDFSCEDLFNTGNVVQTPDINLSNFDREAVDTHPNPSSNCDDFSSRFCSDEDSVPMLDSFSDGDNSGNSSNGSHNVDIQPSITLQSGINHSDTSIVLDYFSLGTACDSSNEMASCCCVGSDYPSEVLDGNTDGRKCSKDCSNSDVNSFIIVKRGRKGRKFPASSNGAHRLGGGVVNIRGPPGRENNHSVWQRVQKNDVDECIYEPRNMSSYVPKRGSSVVVSDVVLSKTKDAYSRNRISENLKRKPSSSSKEEHNHNSRKGPHTNKTTSIRPTKMNVQQKEASKIPLPVSFHKSFGTGSRSPSFTDCGRLGVSLTNRVDCCPSEPLQNSESRFKESNPPENVCTVQNQGNPLSGTSDSPDKKHLVELSSDSRTKIYKDLPTDFQLPTGSEGNGTAKLETVVPQSEYSKQDHNTGSILQKWIPVGRKDAELLDPHCLDSLLTSNLGESVDDRWNLKSIEDELVPSGNARVTCLSPREVENNMLTYQACTINKVHSTMGALSNCPLTPKAEEQCTSVLKTDVNRISEVLNDAHRLQIESEGVQLATGSPLAEFERFLHSASPVLGQKHSVQICKSCSRDQRIGDSLCRHQIPNISLGSLWQWYERPGSYGLEVKAEDFQNSNKLSGHSEFRAYFVPFLSALQLFAKSKCSICMSSTLPNARKTCDVDKAPENSSHFTDSIFSILLPRPHREENDSLSLPVNSFCALDSFSASGQNDFCNHSANSAYPGDSELLFEYFESEQPQLRLPLFDKINELIRGHVTSNCQVFGDPLQLDCLHLNDLHPSSWYSVAWYPIYRIPDGNFRAAFLTYHSLGHFIRRSASLDSLGGETCIVSPVVGLQSYNAQGECWFRPRNSTMIQTKGNPHFNTSEILKERLRTLEQTASVMARATVRKGDEILSNRQSDYEFFLSRRRVH